MTKKHFIELADALKRHNASDALIAAVSDVLKRANPRFDRTRFYNAAKAEVEETRHAQR